MEPIYYSDEKNLSKFIEELLDPDSTVVIPDLQRPYVWDPKEVILLVDSIFKRWPFGSILCWEVQKHNGYLGFVPYRSFLYECIRNVPNKKSLEYPKNNDASRYTMILDGQQRLQSLLLALGGDSFGFTLTDKEWKKIIEEKDENIDSKHWSTGCLCIDTSIFLSEYEEYNGEFTKIDIRKFLFWKVTNKNIGLSPCRDAKSVSPIIPSDDKVFIRLSKIWKEAKSSELPPSIYEENLKKNFLEISSEKLNPFIKPLSEFMVFVAKVKSTTNVTRIIIKNFEKSGIADRNNYNDAIVEIFTRLNSAGRVLTKQEITLAWLKLGWREANELNNSNQTECDVALQTLLAELNDNPNNMKMSMDDLVDILSLFWIIVDRKGDSNNELTLSTKDFADRDTMKSIGENTLKNWDIIEEAIREGEYLFGLHKLNECFPHSLHAFNIICGWLFIVKISEKKNKGKGPIKDTELKFNYQINDNSGKFIDKWFFSTSLSNWSYANFVGQLCKLHKAIIECQDIQRSITIIVEEFKKMLSSLRLTTINRIKNLRAYNRSEVRGYKNILWLWNRLSSERWEEVKKPMKLKKRRQMIWEVDHAIPIKIWENMVENEYPLSSSIDALGQEIDFEINGGKYKRSELLSIINLLGNCSLEYKNYNRSKGKLPFGEFLNEIYDNDQIEKVKNTLQFNSIFLFPNEVTVQQILMEIEIRTNNIKNELIGYFNNESKEREDIEYFKH
jgi:hypothetical protein